MVNAIIGDVTRELIDYIYLQTKKKNNHKKLEYIKNILISIIVTPLQPYLYTILAILIIIILMNCFSFYYYIRLFMKSNPTYDINMLEMSTHQ